jgi:predicted Zn-dependent protease
VLQPIPLPKLAPGQTRHDAGAMLDSLLAIAPDDTFRITGVTQAPLRAAEHDTLIGYARRSGRALVYSTDGLWPMLVTEAAHRRFTRRIIAHELGHTHGGTHCERRCVLSDVKSAVDIDDQPDGYCAEHAARAEKALAIGPEHFDAKVRLGAERLRLGLWRQAVDAYRHALRSRPGDPRVRTSLGVALMAHGEWLAAEQAFTDATRDTPDAPQPFYARAVLYAASGDTHRAPAFIEAAVNRDGDQKRAHRAAGILYEDVIGDERSAARHYHAHLRVGGRNKVVIERLVKLMSPTTLVFHDPELVIARWQPGEGLILASARGYSGGFR